MSTPLETTFHSVWAHAESRPDHPALVSDGARVTYRELKSAVARAATGIRLAGVKPGDRVCLETNEPIDHMIGSIATMLCGAIAVAVPNDSAASYEAVVADAAPTLLIVNGERTFDVATSARTASVGALMKAGADEPAGLRQPQPEEIAMIYYTSGTSGGVRKGVLQSYRQLSATARYISEVMKLDDSIVEYVASPMDNAFWYGRCRVVLRMGGTALLSTGKLNPLKILSALRQHNGNAIAGDTPIFALFLHHMSPRLKAIGPQIKWAKVASQAMSVEDKRALEEHLPNARIIMNYGLTEAMRCCLLPFKDHPDKLASVGRPSPSVEIRIMSSDHKPLGANERGEIEVRGPNLASGYLHKDSLWQSRIRDGWYVTADLGYVDEDGFVYVLGRNDEAINVGGRKVAPTEVEGPLQKLLPGRQLAVFALPDPSAVLGHVVALVVEGEWNLATPWKDFRIHLFEQLPASHVPHTAFSVDKMPLTTNGKVQRSALTRLAAAGELQKL